MGLTPKQETLKRKHGTPVEFHYALIKGWQDGFITMRELDNGNRKYRLEWDRAGRRKGRRDES